MTKLCTHSDHSTTVTKPCAPSKTCVLAPSGPSRSPWTSCGFSCGPLPPPPSLSPQSRYRLQLSPEPTLSKPRHRHALELRLQWSQPQQLHGRQRQRAEARRPGPPSRRCWWQLPARSAWCAHCLQDASALPVGFMGGGLIAPRSSRALLSDACLSESGSCPAHQVCAAHAGP